MASITNLFLGYHINEQIYAGTRTLVYRGLRSENGQPVAIKVLRNEFPCFNELVHFRNQYVIAKNLEIPGSVKAYSLETYENHYALVMEDFGGISLSSYLALLASESQEPLEGLPVSEFLPIAIQIANSLDGLYRHHVIHKDLKPANILINPSSKQVKLIDFSIASLLPRETQEIQNPNVLEGTLPYISPEQTGRMNRGIDYRTDFYSLGVTFYELLTGKLPFQSADALSLVHCHLAKVPVSPREINSERPKAVSDIVMKLMAKTAEERYQSAWGLQTDLENCLSQLQKTGNISCFWLASNDISDKFQIPQKLYGREAEIETLLTAFERVAAGGGRSPQPPVLRGTAENLPGEENTAASSESPLGDGGRISQGYERGIEMMLVAGYSGIGKSSLVAEIHKPNTRLRGYFTEGKFDQFQRNIPYSAIVSAFKGLVRQLLSENSSQLAQWREKLLAALGANGQVIIDVIPEVELIVGKQPPVPELGSTGSQNRFNLVFGQFIRAFCTKEHPLVIFLNDLQWADSATLKLIELMMTDNETQYLFLIGAYRDNEVNPAHPLMMTLEA